MGLSEHALPDAAGFPLSVGTRGPNDTAALGSSLAGLLVGGEVILLHGDLGAGKTCLAQGLCRGLDVAEEVVSPTFTLVNTYRGRLIVHHLDFYRIEPDADLGDIGLPDILDEVATGGAILVAEWPDRLIHELEGFGFYAELLGEPGKGPEDRLWRFRGFPDLPEPWLHLLSARDGGGAC